MRNPQGGAGAARQGVVGYAADQGGAEAIALAGALALGAGIELVVTQIVPEQSAQARGGAEPPLATDPILQEQLQAWDAEARSRLPAGVPARSEARIASSEAHGLLESAAEHDAEFIAIGARTAPLLRPFTIGSTGTTLLHSSPVPVALAPAGYAFSGPVPRITAVYGTRPGASAVIGAAIEAADRRGVPLRLLSLLPDGGAAAGLSTRLREEASRFGGELLGERAAATFGTETASIDIVSGEDLDDAAARSDWLPGEIAVLGSSRLAASGRVFIGPTVQRLLRRLPASVGVVVIPRDFGGDTTGEH